MIDGIILWQSLYFFALSALAIFFVCRFQIPIIAKIFWGYCIVSPLYLLFHPFDSPTTNPIFADKLSSSAGQAVAMLLLIPYLFLQLERRHFRNAKFFFVAIGVIDAILIWVFGQGFFSADSFDGSFLALLLSIVESGPVSIFFLITILKTKSLTALCIVIAQITVAAWHRSKRLALLAPMFVGLGWGGYLYFQGKNFSSAGNRMDHWKNLLDWWLTNANYFFGTGFGSFYWYSPVISEISNRVILFAHNDWFQLFFEGGIVGLSLGLTLFVILFRASSLKLRITWAGIAACMLTYHPIHFLFSAGFIALSARMSLEDMTPVRFKK